MKNKGINSHRLSQNKLEQKFAESWEERNTDRNGMLNGDGVLDYLLAEKKNFPNFEATDRDREVAATVIQWLGSPVGESFVNSVLRNNE